MSGAEGGGGGTAGTEVPTYVLRGENRFKEKTRALRLELDTHLHLFERNKPLLPTQIRGEGAEDTAILRLPLPCEGG